MFTFDKQITDEETVAQEKLRWKITHISKVKEWLDKTAVKIIPKCPYQSNELQTLQRKVYTYVVYCRFFF